MRKAGRDPHALREAILLGLGCFIMVVWAVATLGGQFTGKPVDTEVHLVALTVAGGLFGSAAIAGRKSNGNGNGGGSKGA